MSPVLMPLYMGHREKWPTRVATGWHRLEQSHIYAKIACWLFISDNSPLLLAFLLLLHKFKPSYGHLPLL